MLTGWPARRTAMPLTGSGGPSNTWPNSRSPAATSLPSISSRLIPAARTVKRCGPSTAGVMVPVHRADQTAPVSPSGAVGMSTVGTTTVRAGSPSEVSAFQYSPSSPVPAPPGAASTPAGTTGGAASPNDPLGERNPNPGPGPGGDAVQGREP